MRSLDLFSGTGSVGRIMAEFGYEVVSVDMDSRWNADIVVDVDTWDYRAAFPEPDRGNFDTVFAAPPCTEYSRALTTRPRCLEKSNRLVRRTLEIIEYLRPRCWFMENPRTGLLCQQTMVQSLRYVDVDYCQFSAWKRAVAGR